MKKALILSTAMAFGVTASAAAANPFSDVPEGHWAYQSINKLAAQGVIDGYPDGTYGGDKLMTRYEMAQIVARAMAGGADVDKLAAEFSDELDSLGVRAANLEKKTGNVKIAGQIRMHYAGYRDGADKHWNTNSSSKIRTRIFVTGQINEDWSYNGRFENTQNLRNSTGDDTLELDRAFVEGKLGGVKLRAGRTWGYFGEGNIFDENLDGVIASYGKDVKIEAVYGKAPKQLGWDYKDVYGGAVSASVKDLKLGAGYYKFGDAQAAYSNDPDNAIWHADVSYKTGDITLGAMYFQSDENDSAGDDNGYVISLNYKGAKAAEPGSYGINAQYFDQAGTTAISHTMNGEYPYRTAAANAVEGFDGYKLAGYYTVAKNVVAGIEYFALEGNKSGEDYDTLWTQLIFTF